MNEHSIFLAVLKIDDPAERSAYLDIACAGDPAMRSHVEQLLKAHQESGRVMDCPTPQRPAEELATPGKLGETQDETPADDTDIDVLGFLSPSDKLGVLGLQAMGLGLSHRTGPGWKPGAGSLAPQLRTCRCRRLAAPHGGCIAPGGGRSAGM